MDFTHTDSQIALLDMASRFADDQLAPHAARWDKEHFFPVENLRAAAGLGLATLYVPETLGGGGLSRLDAALIFERLSQGCIATTAYLTIHNMVAWMLASFGNPEQCTRYLPRLHNMTWLASYCLTEPQSGSDAASLRTSATRDGDDYILNGSKAFISGGGVSDLYLVMARTGSAGAKGISAFIVEKTMPGVSFGVPEAKMGWNAQPTTSVHFDSVRVPAANLMGSEGQGFSYAMQALDGGRINIAACSLGGATRALAEAKHYMKERQQFGRPLADFQALQFRLADMVTHLHASRLMVYAAAAALDSKQPDATAKCAMAKRFATDTAWQIADDALQMLGGYGYIQDYPMERILRDLRVHRILEGTNEIMRVVIARAALQESSTLC